MKVQKLEIVDSQRINIRRSFLSECPFTHLSKGSSQQDCRIRWSSVSGPLEKSCVSFLFLW